MVEVPAIDRSSTTDRVAGALREMIFAGDLSPGGPLREVTLAESFGVARSTVREALQVLTAEKLLTRLGLNASECACVGDDVIDVPILGAPGDAQPRYWISLRETGMRACAPSRVRARYNWPRSCCC